MDISFSTKFNRTVYMREYRLRNKEKIQAYQKSYAEDNKEVRKQQKRVRDQRYRELHKEEILKRERTPKRRYQTAKNDAKRRGLEFNLSFDYWQIEVNKTCHYCRDVLGKRSETTVGLDRLDNSKGYVEGNVASCCAFCNFTKGDRLTSEEMRVVANALIQMRKIS